MPVVLIMAPFATLASAEAVDEFGVGDVNPNGLQAAQNQDARLVDLLHAQERHLFVHRWWHHHLNGNLPFGFFKLNYGNF